MKRRLQSRRPSPAMLVAVIALISSLTGGAVAATLIDTGDIQNGAVTKKKLHKNAVNSKKVKNKTLKAKDFADGQLEQGVQGIQGLQGDKGEKGDPGEDGAAGATNVVVRRANVPLAASGFTQAGIGCEAGELATGGGFSTGLDAAYAMRSTPSDDGGNNAAQDGEVPNGWVIRFHNTSATTSTGTISVICASP